MTDIDGKIYSFMEEIGMRKLNPEQSKVYAAFTKTKGRPVSVSTIDSEGESISFKMDSSKKGDGPQHILSKHYMESQGRVTANEILNMCDIVRRGKRSYESNCVCYRMNKRYNGITYTICIKIGRKDNYLKTFYSNRGYLKTKKGSNHPVVSRIGRPRK